MKKEELIKICLEENNKLKQNYKSFHSDILLEAIIERIKILKE